MNDNGINGTLDALDGLTLDSTPLDLGSFDGLDPFAGEEEAVETPAAESNITPLPLSRPEEPPLSPEPAAPVPRQAKTLPPSAPVENPLRQAIEQAEEKDVKQAAAPLFSRPPVFCYGGVNEEITNPKLTFDQLREEKARDFSELEDAFKVSWTVEYGKTVRAIGKPKTEVIFGVKKEQEEYRVVVPTQWVGKASVDALLREGDVLDEERYLHFADIHSHNTMAAKFSLTDDQDEKVARVYLVAGRLDRFFPQVEARISCNGRFVPIPVEQVIAPLPQKFPGHWADTVHMGRREVA